MDFVIGARKNFTQSALAGRSLVAELADAAEPTPISGEGRRQGLEGDLIWFLFKCPSLFVSRSQGSQGGAAEGNNAVTTLN
jgi:hypothetical protein